MSLRTKFISILSLGAATIAFSTFTFAQETTTPSLKVDKADKIQRGEGRGGRFGHRGGFGRGEMGPRRGMRGGLMALHGLNLTDAQKEQIKTIMQSNKPNEATMTELRTIMQARRDGTITDAQKARAKELREQMQANRKSVHTQILNVLTAEQKAQLEARKAERKARMEQFRQQREEWRKNRPAKPTAAPAPAAKPATIN